MDPSKTTPVLLYFFMPCQDDFFLKTPSPAASIEGLYQPLRFRHVECGTGLR